MAKKIPYSPREHTMPLTRPKQNTDIAVNRLSVRKRLGEGAELLVSIKKAGPDSLSLKSAGW
jgi:hypothetical protein